MRKIVSQIILHRVNHRDFEGMVLSLKGLREIFLAFTIACISQSGKIFKTTNFSGIERSLNVVTLR
jgi:CRISPR-associated protein Csa3